MIFEVRWHEAALEDLRALKDKALAKKIIAKVRDYLAQNPLSLGKPLTGPFSGLYRYRYGKIRVIYVLDQELRILSVLQVGQRKEVYRR
ncbi:type II toxin-antitoxin system RelE family toxin [Geoalkalibacter sp.]|uniref:type II toxin-antitoxin system RelE family toxin n=1 Tax=Geoalkalibacter sp. TaxID=3041440 RepID=UPI00272DCF0F|nr:type II toxin-antitoxin system RelE/ParE family toxin [Geoalkalibacter sp.]